MKKVNLIVVILSILTIALFPISVYGTVIAGILLLGFTLVKVEDEKTQNKVLQNLTLAGILVAVKCVVSMFTYMFKNFCYLDSNCLNNGFFEFQLNFEYFMNGFIGIACIAFVVIAILSVVLNFSLPLFGKVKKQKEPKKVKEAKSENKEIVIDEDEEI